MRIKKMAADWANYRTTVKQLNSLSDHMLNDLGIERGNIGQIARATIRGN